MKLQYIICSCFSLSKSFHPFLLSGKPHRFSFYEAPEKNRASKNFRLYPHNFCDTIKFRWCNSPLRMIFYSTKFPSSKSIKYLEISPIMPESFHPVKLQYIICSCFSPIESFHPFLLSGKPHTFSFYEAPEKIGASKNFRLYPHNFCDTIKFRWCNSPLRMIFYSTKFPSSKSIKYLEISPIMPESFHPVKLQYIICSCFSPIESFHPFLLSGKPHTFSFYEAPEKIGASKNFRLYPHNFCDTIKLRWCNSPLYMIFYSTKFPSSMSIKYLEISPNNARKFSSLEASIKYM